MLGQVFLDLTSRSTKQGIMGLTQGTQSSGSGEAQNATPQSRVKHSTIEPLPFSHHKCAMQTLQLYFCIISGLYELPCLMQRNCLFVVKFNFFEKLFREYQNLDQARHFVPQYINR